jgi:hypothetical protein
MHLRNAPEARRQRQIVALKNFGAVKPERAEEYEILKRRATMPNQRGAHTKKDHSSRAKIRGSK